MARELDLAPSLEARAGSVNETVGDPVDLEIPHAASTAYLTHGLFRYVGKLPPPIMALLLQRFTSEGDVVLDPMCGGGTTAIEAVSSGRLSVNFDINPVSRLITEAVSVPLMDGVTLAAFADEVLAVARPASPLGPLEQYFSPETFGILSTGLRIASSPVEKALVLSIARSASFANTKKINTVVDRTKMPKAADRLLRAAADKFDVALDALKRTTPPFASVSAAAATAVPLDDESVDFVLLHPPYLTNTAFSEVTHLQLLLLGQDPLKLRGKELAYRGSYFHVPNGLRKYLVGWSQTLGEAVRVLRPGGHVGVINGDGRIDHVRIPIGAITEEFGADLGLKLRLRAFHRLNNHTGMTLSRRMTGQHVIVFEK